MVYYIPQTSLTRVIAKKTVIEELKSRYENRNEDLIEIVLCDPPDHKNRGGIDFRGISWAGMMGAGKSTQCKQVIRVMKDKFGDDLHIVMGGCNDTNTEYMLELCKTQLGDGLVQVIIFDDANFLIDSEKKIKAFKAWISYIRHMWENCTEKKYDKKKEFGIIYLILLFQERYDMNSRIRNYLEIQINMQLGNENWYVQDATRQYGEEAVTAVRGRRAKILAKGKYELKGYGIIQAPFVDGGSTGYVHFELDEKDTQDLEDLADVNLNEILGDYQKVKGIKIKSKIPDYEKINLPASFDAWDGLAEAISEVWLKRPNMVAYYRDGIFSEKTKRFTWTNGKSPKRHTELQIRERIFGWVQKHYLGWKNKDIIAFVVKNREKAIANGVTGLTSKIVGRTFYNTYSNFTNFFSQHAIRKMFGDCWEFFCYVKLVKAKEMLEKEGIDDEVLQKIIDYFRDGIFIHKDKFEKRENDIVFKMKNQYLLALNVKYNTIDGGRVEPTPEDNTAIKNDCLMGCLVIEEIDFPSIKLEVYQPENITLNAMLPSPETYYVNWSDVLMKIYRHLYYNRNKKK